MEAIKHEETVLIIEDETSIRQLLHEALINRGSYKVLEAADGEEGLEMALEYRPDVILLDLMLPRLHGIQVMEELRAQGIRIPIIVITAHGNTENILQTFRLGARDFLNKPFYIPDVWAALENALAEEHLRREKENLTRALARANRRLQRQLENWTALNDLAKAILSTLEEPEVLRRVIETVGRILKVEAGSILLLEEETNELYFAITLEGEASRFLGVTLQLGQGIAGWVAQNRTPLLVPDVQQEPRFYAEVDEITGFRSESILCVPLLSHDRVLGVLEVINKQEGAEQPAFNKDDLEMLTALASWGSIAVENARLNREMQDTAAIQAMKQAVITLAHYINNQLMVCSLELDSLENATYTDEQQLRVGMDSARKCIDEITTVVRALERLKEVRTIPYIGDTKMVDLGDLLGSVN